MISTRELLQTERLEPVVYGRLTTFDEIQRRVAAENRYDDQLDAKITGKPLTLTQKLLNTFNNYLLFLTKGGE